MKRLRKYDCREFFIKRKPFLMLLSLATLAVIIIYFLVRRNDSKSSIKKFWKGDSHYDLSLYKDLIEEKFGGERLVHLDLKGAPPKVAYLEKLFPLLAKLGTTGLLIEYEDMFPYHGDVLGEVPATNAYSLEDIQTILKVAEESRLSVIPLIQTFGHMEFMLKLKGFEHFRETLDYPQVICPSNNKTLDLIMLMVDQIIRAHPKATKLHIGADEVWFIGVCDRCIDVLNRFGWTKNQLFLEHVSSIAHKIKNRYPHVRILMWDDEFRSMSYKELKSSQISSLIEPVVWKYTTNVYEELGPSLWDMYGEIFPRIWIASAFKGATGSNQYVTDITHHLQNQRSWMSIVSEYKDRIQFEGIFITGWQRYDHFAVLCELLPVGIPSLAMSLRLLLGYNESPLSPPTEVARLLQCEQPYGLIGPTFGLPKCVYPGGEVLDIILRFHQMQEEYTHMLADSRVKGWLHSYNIEHEFSNPQYVESGTASLHSLKVELEQLEADLQVAMQNVYDNYTISEWNETYLKPFVMEIKKLWNGRQKLLSRQYWPRRPLTENTHNEL